MVAAQKPNFAPSPGYFLRRCEVGIANKSWFLLRQLFGECGTVAVSCPDAGLPLPAAARTKMLELTRRRSFLRG